MKISNILHKVILTLSTLCLLNPLLIVQAGEVTSHTLPDNQWHLISLPYSPGTNNTINDIFGDDGLGVYDSDWVIYSYNTATNKYIKPRLTDTLSQGVGYWIIQYTDSDKKLDMPKNSTPTTNTAACSTDNCFKIPLATKPGTSQWNMLGYPFSSEELLSKTRVDTTSPICSSGCTIEEAKDEGIIQNQLLSYNGSTYKTINATTGSLKPWLGYWANTENNADGKSPSLVIPKPEECSIFPADNPWNKDISSLPVHPKSGAYMASIGLGGRLHPDFGTVWNGAPNGIPVVDVQADTPRRNVEFKYSSESDHQPYPIPDTPPIEGGPDGTGDRHIIMVDRSACKLYELFGSFPPGASENPFSDSWYAGSGAIFDLTTNNLRPDFWTSADAAGLPVYPGLVKYDEVMVQKEIRHALRFTVKKSQRAFIHPATHFASSSTDQNLPPMGLRVRLKASFDISGFPEEVQVILKALKKYGMLLADNGGNWFISGSPDPRWSVDNLSKLHNVPGSAFEAVSTGALITR